MVEASRLAHSAVPARPSFSRSSSTRSPSAASASCRFGVAAVMPRNRRICERESTNQGFRAARTASVTAPIVSPFSTAQNVAWEVGVQFGRNRGKVTDLGGAQIFDLLEGFGANEAEGADVIGYAPGVIIGTGFVHCSSGTHIAVPGMGAADQDIDALCAATPGGYRSEERRVGKECRSRWSPYH